jgi:hypothetical protein
VCFGQADANKGQILGTVTDPNGAVVPNAAITIRSSSTGFTREVKSDENGQYRAVLLDPGTYEVSGQAHGFAQATVTGIVLPVGGAAAADIGLRVESTTTSVEVSDTLVQISLPQPTELFNTFHKVGRRRSHILCAGHRPGDSIGRCGRPALRRLRLPNGNMIPQPPFSR